MIPSYLCREHTIQCDADLIRTMTEAEWRAFVAGKYPDFDGGADDFTSGPPHPALAPENEK